MRCRPDRKSSPACGSLALKICVWCAKSGCGQAAYPVSIAFCGAENMAIYHGCAEGWQSCTRRAELAPRSLRTRTVLAIRGRALPDQTEPRETGAGQMQAQPPDAS